MEANGFASALISSRIAAKLGQAALGKRIGVRQSSISSWEQGRLIPVKENVAKLKEVFPELPEPQGSREIAKPTGNPDGSPGHRSETAKKHMSAAQRARAGRPRIYNGRTMKPRRPPTVAAPAVGLAKENRRLRKLVSDFSACIDLAREVLAKV